MRLTNAEEQLMRHLWSLDRAYLKNILDEFPEPKPAATTIASVLKRLIDKGFIGFNQHGSNREYYPKVRKTEYFSKHLNSIIKNYFNNSASQFASFFTNEADLDLTELEYIKKLVEKKIESRKK